MPKAKSIVKRRKAVTNIKKITRTMQLIATARYQKALQRAVKAKPYTEKIGELVAQVSRQMQSVRHPLLRVNSGAGRSALLVITSNRGLCGGYNARILGAALTHVKQIAPSAGLSLDVVGKKGIAYFRFLGREIRRRHTQFEGRARFEDVQGVADEFMDLYGGRKVDAIHVAYMKFISLSRQSPTVMQLLPLQTQDVTPSATREREASRMYDFSPPPAELLAELLPESVRSRLFQCFVDAAVSEQITRMVAMKAATDAASDMIKILTRTYNRARQAQITTELLDIMGGAEALV